MYWWFRLPCYQVFFRYREKTKPTFLLKYIEFKQLRLKNEFVNSIIFAWKQNVIFSSKNKKDFLSNCGLDVFQFMQSNIKNEQHSRYVSLNARVFIEDFPFGRFKTEFKTVLFQLATKPIIQLLWFHVHMTTQKALRLKVNNCFFFHSHLLSFQ